MLKSSLLEDYKFGHLELNTKIYVERVLHYDIFNFIEAL